MQKTFQPEATLLFRALSRNQLFLTVLIWTQRYLYRAAKNIDKIVPGLLSPPSASLLTVLHPCQGWLGLWQSTISAGSCNSDSGNSAPQWLPLHQTSTTLSNASPSLSCLIQESNQFQHQVEVLLEASSTFPGTSSFSILSSPSAEKNFMRYTLKYFFCVGKHSNMSSCVFSADSSSEYAFAAHSPAVEERRDERRKDLVDFVRYLVFLNAIPRHSRVTPSRPLKIKKSHQSSKPVSSILKLAN